MLTRRELFERAYGQSFESAEAHNPRSAATRSSCVAALAALGLLTDELIARVGDMGERFAPTLTRR